MPRVHTVKARKDYPNEGIKKGDTYYKWSKRVGGPYSRGVTYRSKTYPKPQQLTSSDYLIGVYDAQDAISNIDVPNKEDGTTPDLDGAAESIKSEIENVVSDLETLRDETQEKFDNMPEGLQQGDTGQLLEERVSNVDDWINELQALDAPEREEGQSDEDYHQALKDFIEEVHQCMGND
jgi:hypothetical protein